MPTGVPILDIIAGLQTALCEVAPSFDDEHNLERHDHSDVGRFVWVFGESIRSSGPIEIGGNPPALLADEWAIDVHCWGANKERSLRMRQALLTAVASAGGPGVVSNIRTSFRGGQDVIADGWVSIVSFELKLPLFAARFVGLGGIVEDATERTVRPTVAGFSASGAVQGDGKLNVGEV